MLQYILTVIALLLVIEGLLPAIAPRTWRMVMHRLILQRDQVIRTIGLVTMIIGAVLMYLVHSGLL